MVMGLLVLWVAMGYVCGELGGYMGMMQEEDMWGFPGYGEGGYVHGCAGIWHGVGYLRVGR